MDPTKLLDDEPGFVQPDVLAAETEIDAPTQEAVSDLAYSYWEARGFQGGSPWEDWFRAEEELKRRQEL